jgi:tetratricopeptide (TPR) repeat protein
MELVDPGTLAADAARVYQQGDFETAARLFGEAASAFQAAGKQLDAAEMKNNQSVAFLQAGNAQASFDSARGTSSLFAGAGDTRREGIALGNEGTALQALGRSNEAAEAYRLAAEAFAKSGEDQMRATVMQAIAGIELKQGKIMKSLLTLRTGLIGVKNPTLKQRILQGLLRLWVW